MRLYREPALNGRVFVDRQAAGRFLGEHLEAYRGPGLVVLGIPRGGVAVAFAVARQLGAELDVVVARKVGDPYQPELALGAVTANGGLFLNDEIIAESGVSPGVLERAIQRERTIAREREALLRAGRPAVSLAGKTVIIVDDGLATGATVRAAVRSVRQHQPGRLIVAVPVGSREACAVLALEADAVVCPQQPEPFYAVGLYYENFGQVEDEEVQRLLLEASSIPAPVTPVAPPRIQ